MKLQSKEWERASPIPPLPNLTPQDSKAEMKPLVFLSLSLGLEKENDDQANSLIMIMKL